LSYKKSVRLFGEERVPLGIFMSCVHRLWPSTDGNQCWPTWGPGKKDGLGNGIGKLKKPGHHPNIPPSPPSTSESQVKKLISQQVINIKFCRQPKKGHNETATRTGIRNLNWTQLSHLQLYIFLFAGI